MPKLILTGDIFRANQDLSFNQAQNVRWFSSIFKPILKELNYKVDVLDTNNYKEFFEHLYGIIYKYKSDSVIDIWASIYDNLKLEEEIRLLFLQIECDLIFIFEGSRSLLRLFEKSNVKYFNFRVHPLRFGTDLIFSIQTNDTLARERLSNFEVDDNFIQNEVNQLRERMGGGASQLEEGSFVFLAQTANDSSLVVNGAIARLASYETEVRQAVGHKKTYHKRHPHDVNQTTITNWCRIFPKSKEFSGSLYPLIALSKNISFITLSSGAAYEAELLGHTVIRLIDINHSCTTGSMPITFTNSSHIAYAFWYADFWDYVLSGRSSWDISRGNHVPNRLRSAIGVEWSRR
jgi:hypothetical protein